MTNQVDEWVETVTYWGLWMSNDKAFRSRPTIRDVAAEAGVSYATVSRALNGHKWVGAKSMHAVQRAVAKIGYTANPHARSLATGRSGTVAFLLTEPQERLFEDPTFAQLLRGATRALSDRGLTLILMLAGSDDERGRALGYLGAGHVDGVLVVSSHSGDPLPAQLAAGGVHVVSCGRIAGLEGTISSVAADDVAGARCAVEHLIASPCRRIATITGPMDTSGGVDRLRGYTEALQQHGLPIDEHLVAHGDWSRPSGRAAMASVLTVAPDVDAVFAANDRMADGALTALRAAGRTVPGDVRLAGVDDSGLAISIDPPLTSVRVPLDEIGREMVRVICERGVEDVPVTVTIPTSLVVRASAP